MSLFDKDSMQTSRLSAPASAWQKEVLPQPCGWDPRMESVRHKLVNVWIEANYCTWSLLTWWPVQQVASPVGDTGLLVPLTRVQEASSVGEQVLLQGTIQYLSCSV
jgi:hypothetical protein